MPEEFSEADRANEMEEAVFALLAKFHAVIACGKDGNHWPECDNLVEACGWDSWEAWEALAAG